MIKNVFEKLSSRGWQLVIVLIPIVVTAIAIYIRSLGVEQQKALFEQRKYAYAEFFEGTAKYWRADKLYAKAKKEADASRAGELRKDADKLEEEYELLWSQARFKIGVLSDAKVVKAFADYLAFPEFNNTKCEGNVTKWEKDVATYQAMRNEAHAKGDVEDWELALVLFGCKLEK